MRSLGFERLSTYSFAMHRLKAGATRQIGDGSRQLQDAMLGPGDHVQLLPHCPQQAIARAIDLVVLPHLARPQAGIRHRSLALDTMAMTALWRGYR